MKKLAIVVGVLTAVLIAAAMADPAWAGRGKCSQPGFHEGHGAGDGPGCGHGEAPGKCRGDGPPGIGMLLRLADEINLTENQQQQLRQMQVQFATEKVDKQAELEKTRIKLRALMADEKALESDIMMAIDRTAQLKADLQKMRYRRHKQVRSLLTEQQVDKLKQLHQEKMQQQGPRSGRRINPRGPGYGCWFDDDLPEDEG
ncbi:MAG: hypothetical protein AB1744_13745 [Candidatus Zixiibacteriota bacterium]